jgi:hypothetical protein
MSSIFDTLRASGQNHIEPPEKASMSLEQAIQEMDAFFSVVISTMIRKNRGLPAKFNGQQMSEMLSRSKIAAKVVHDAERSGTPLKRVFSSDHWKDLADMTTLDDAEFFANSSAMHPSVCCRIILSSVNTA